MSFIISTTKGILQDSFKHNSKRLNVLPDNIQIFIGVQPSGDKFIPVYTVMSDWDFSKREVLNYRQLTGKTMDIMGTEQICEDQLPKLMERVAKEKTIELSKTAIAVVSDKDAKKIGLVLYHNWQPVKNITIDYLFGEAEDV